MDTIRTPKMRRHWDDGVPEALKPFVRAYLLGYASVVGPRILTLVLQRVAGRRRSPSSAKGNASIARGSDKFEPITQGMRRILASEMEWQRFPTFCAAVVGGSALLKVILKALFDRWAKDLGESACTRLSRWFGSFIAAWLSIKLLQSKQGSAFTEQVVAKSDVPPGVRYRTVRYAGRTLDLTLFAATRALDVLIGELWARHRARRVAAHRWTPTEEAICRLTDPALFALSSGLVMWTWIYYPSRLPRAYDKWIGSAAAVDWRLTEALRRVRSREMLYGKDTGQAHLLRSMCTEYGLPPEWGDPRQAIPFPCEIVHMGTGSNCEYHALSRFARSWRWAMASYLPLNLLLVIRTPHIRGVFRALLLAARSSAFLGAFITLFYYGVCLARTRLGPRILGTSPTARQHIDSGICVGAGCFLCGWSIMLEYAGRRKDMALFVAPRALATLLPRRYALDKQWRETFCFAASTAVLFTCVLENPKRVRGVLGGVLGSVMRL